MEVIELQKDSQGWYSCHVPISKARWAAILTDKALTTDAAIISLLSFYYMPAHQASCSDLEAAFGRKAAYYLGAINMFCRKVQQSVGTFTISGHGADAAQVYWPVAMARGREEDGHFVWQLRPELSEALRDWVVDWYVARYAAAFPSLWPDERYKWEAAVCFADNWDIDAPDFAGMFARATAKADNLLSSQNSYPRDMILNFCKVDTEFVREMFRNLFDENRPAEERISGFIDASDRFFADHFPTKGRSNFQSTNAVTTYLWLRYPDRYPIYKYRIFRSVAEAIDPDVSIAPTGKTEEVAKGYAMYGSFWPRLEQNALLISEIKQLADAAGILPIPQRATILTDFGYWLGRYNDTFLKDSLIGKYNTSMTPLISKACNLLRAKKNLILQGAPGTGKTYNTAALAVAVIDGKLPENHDDVMARYQELRRAGRIDFTTFHQSMDYEDFVEGIKPDTEGDNVRYRVSPGIFKRMCNAARKAADISETGTDNIDGLDLISDNPTVWKVSLEGTGDNATRRECMENSHIRIGWPSYGDRDFADNYPDVTDGRFILHNFQHDMKVGDIVVSCWSQFETDAIGVITGDYEFNPEGGDYPRYRDVKWIAKGFVHNIADINHGKRMVLPTVYRLQIDLKDILSIIRQYAPAPAPAPVATERPFVLIIDEINRGNVSKIFGELITLIEKDKRLAVNDSDNNYLTLPLPYSRDNERFGVPQNLYIIGTMNTTDRSTGTIDYALRRRFAFLTIPADRSIVRSDTARALFDDVKAFILQYRDPDIDIDGLMVGHSYFMADDDAELAMKIEYEVIPLIREYIKDGILVIRPGQARKYFDSWLQLKPFHDSDTSGSTPDA